MQKFCFNYAIEGVSTFLPVFICAEGNTQDEAFDLANRYLESGKFGGFQIWNTNYPDQINSEFSTKHIPKDFK